ncbi:unnamed protein product [Macrosiphum euphorbiae]|uniref:DDE Tnp4 domain-containing protein n=1 Tax=Macrosiphum euphorbiae TaxID=13131 RepID=A0AAV0Y3E3_9HEMI|nr:unnamed protein product [Macrosiphum euphorbiae]
MNCFFQQAVCDHKCRFIHCYAGNVGSVHDQRVFRLSELKNYLDDATKFPNNTHLIGDSAYTLHEHSAGAIVGASGTCAPGPAILGPDIYSAPT